MNPSDPPPAGPAPAWTDADLRHDPHAAADKRSRVQRMFAAIAPKYDLNNRLHSFWQDQRWRRNAVQLAELKPTDHILDVACGTGDLTFALAQRLVVLLKGATIGQAQAIGVDFTFPMLPIARRKGGPYAIYDVRVDLNDRRTVRSNPRRMSGSVFFVNADATALPLADASADVVSIAFGLRNVQEPHKALAEFHRVLRPGGRVIVLEFSQPKNRLIRFFNDLYCAKIMPHTATWLSGDKSGAYKYLPMSVATFLNREQMKQALRDAGFADVTEHPMTFGVAVVYRGHKR